MKWKCGYRLRGHGGNGANESMVEIAPEGDTDGREHDAEETIPRSAVVDRTTVPAETLTKKDEVIVAGSDTQGAPAPTEVFVP